MRRDRNVLAMIEGSSRKRCQHCLRWVMLDAHDSSLRRLRKRPIARRKRDLTVPSGISNA